MQPDRSHFATTRWSLVKQAGQASNAPAVRQGLEQLCQAYWPPLYTYVRRRVPNVSEAQDLTQAFFAELLEKNYVGQAQAERGRFRAFLISALKHFLSKEWDKLRTLKRGHGHTVLSLDFAAVDAMYLFEPVAGLTAEQIFDREWAITLLGQVLERLADEFQSAGKRQQFELLKGFVVGDVVGDTQASSYRQAASELGTTEAAAKQAASRMRRRYRELLRSAIADTVSTPDEVDDEIRGLFEILSR